MSFLSKSMGWDAQTNQARRFGERADQMYGYGSGLMGQGGDVYNQAMQMFDPNSGYYQNQRNLLSRTLGDQYMAAANNTIRQLAAGGTSAMGGAVKRAMTNSRRVGEGVSTGMGNIMTQGMRLGTGLLGQAGNLYGQAGGMFGRGADLQGRQGQMLTDLASSKGSFLNQVGSMALTGGIPGWGKAMTGLGEWIFPDKDFVGPV